MNIYENWAWDLKKKEFSKVECNGYKISQKCLLSLTIREMQVKKLIFHLTQVRMAMINETINSKWWRVLEKWELLVGLQTGVTTVEISVENSKS